MYTLKNLNEADYLLNKTIVRMKLSCRKPQQIDNRGIGEKKKN